MATAKQNFYKWHRILGLTALIPVIFWTLSGLSHPFMSNWFRPTIAMEVFKPLTQSKMKPALSLQQVLDKNAITEFRNFNIVNFNRQTYYQVLGKDSVARYYSAKDASLLTNGDQLYATYLARYFTQDSISSIKCITLQKTFDAQYQPINHLLPVWKVAFNRPDGMDVYIETSHSRIGTFNNNTRKAMLWLFEQFHTWAFLAAIGGEQFRIVALLIVVGCMLPSLLSGLIVYGFFWKKFKTAQQNRMVAGKDDKRFVHRFHRQLGLIVSFVLFTFIISGAFHLLVKLHNIDPDEKNYEQLIDRKDLIAGNLNLPVPDSAISKISLVKCFEKTYFQVSTVKKDILYFDAATGRELKDGDKEFAYYLSYFYRSQQNRSEEPKLINEPPVTQIRQFDNEYGFINKRLPVQKVVYPDGENWYIETTSSKLATKVAGIDLAEGFSFIFLHKYFGMSWAGKNIRDIISMLAALGVLVVSLFGFAAFIKNK
ncbi:PepSY-associated TM helix domain-containing protein [Mucilaginibacter glaciei]|uniref:PepSY domain-containing protein n=1 Tax=Mucilaginibacter glaciei TaxID=2772109 RepID=A0A926NQ93_9SPHI|nr:PepSY-associated TM helix domain-containing protein [Mucilaginibacter glaciei]MBD1392690.1 PepSY domain-containing protein [Mucilaginibacter glaciei]